MNTSLGKDNKLVLIFCIISLFLASCGSRPNKTEQQLAISIELTKVLSNYPAKMVDTLSPIPELVFVLTFINESENDYFLEFQDLLTGTDSNLKAHIVCDNGRTITLPLYKNTGINSLLERNSFLPISFKTKSNEIENEFRKCGNFYLGEVIEKETKSMAITYQGREVFFKSYCKRIGFESPEYFLLE